MGHEIALLSVRVPSCMFLYESWYDSYVKGRCSKLVTADLLTSAFMSTTDAQACEVWSDTSDTSCSALK